MKFIINKSITEEDLIQACIKQNNKAQRELYEKYSRKMFSVCLRYVKDKSEAEEIMIGGFIKVFDKINQFHYEGSFEGWIRKIMVNEALGYLRKNRNMYLEVTIDHANKEVDAQYMENHLEADDLLKMIQRLPPGYQTVFNLYAIEGYSHKEIAGMLSISENTSKSQLSRARVLLQKYLAESEMIIKEKALNHEE